MMRAALLLSLALATGSAAANPLTSLTDRSDILGWEAVGRLNLNGRGLCSASLISPTEVLTAAHCLYEDDARIDPTTITFQAGLRDGETIAEAQVARAAVLPSYKQAEDSFDEIRYDVALLKLATPIPSATADPFPVSGPVGEGSEVTVLSYARGRLNAMSREMGCEALIHYKGVMTFNCQSAPGASGSPIFSLAGRSPHIVALVSGRGGFRGRTAVYGMEVQSLIPELRQAMRTGIGAWPELQATNRKTIGTSDRSTGSARFVKP